MADTIYLVRHAQPKYPDTARICLGQTLDLPISDLGGEQARIIGEALRGMGIRRVFTSPLMRARETAELIAGGMLSVEVLPKLIELYGGAWDGMYLRDIHKQYPDYFSGASPNHSTPPNGEADEAALARGLDALRIMRAVPEETVAAVAHSGFNRILLAHLMGMPLYTKKRIPNPYVGVAVLKYMDGAWKVITPCLNCADVPQPIEE